MSATLEKSTLPSGVVGMGRALVGRSGTRLTAVLGSCIGLVLVHRRLHVAALAHIVLPESRGNAATPAKFADTVIPHLQELLRGEGILASGLVAKIAGGANMFGGTGPMQMGDANAAAVIRCLAEAHIELVAQHVGGQKGRRVSLDCATGEYVVEVVGTTPVVL